MSTPAMQLLSRIVRGGRSEFQLINRWGITQEDFSTQEEIGLWRHILGVNKAIDSRSSVPGIHSIQQDFPHFILCDDESMSTELLCDQVRKHRLTLAIRNAAQEAIENAELGPVEAAAVMHKKLSKVLELGTPRTTDVTFQSAFDEIIHDYNLGESGVDLSRAHWPWPSIQAATGGLQSDDYIVFYGRPKSMKTWVFSYLIAYLFWCNKRILIYTKEMTPKNIFKRIAACIAEISYTELRSTRLEMQDKLRFLETYKEVQSRENQLVCLSGRDVQRGGDTVAWYQAKAEYYKPDVGAIDGLYLMSSGGGPKQPDHQRVMSISRDVSNMRLELDLPIIATMQANRLAAKNSRGELDEIAYSDAVGQDATGVIRVINEKSKPTIALVFAGSREYTLHGVRIGGIPATDFDEKEVMTEKEILNAQEKDVSENEKEEKPKRREPRTNGNSSQLALEKEMDRSIKLS